MKLINETETALLLNLSPITLRKWRSNKKTKIPYKKIGGRIKYDLEEVMAFINSKEISKE